MRAVSGTLIPVAICLMLPAGCERSNTAGKQSAAIPVPELPIECFSQDWMTQEGDAAEAYAELFALEGAASQPSDDRVLTLLVDAARLKACSLARLGEAASALHGRIEIRDYLNRLEQTTEGDSVEKLISREARAIMGWRLMQVELAETAKGSGAETFILTAAIRTLARYLEPKLAESPVCAAFDKALRGYMWARADDIIRREGIAP